MQGYELVQVVYMVSSWLNLALYFIELSLYVFYVCKFPLDRLMHRYVVHAAIITDTVCTMAVCAQTYIFLIIADVTSIMNYTWPVPIVIISNGLSSAIEHTFLTYRIWHLSRKMWLAGVLILLTILHIAFSTMSGIWMGIRPNFFGGFGITATMIGGSIRATTDILIAGILVYQVNKFKSSFISTRTFLHRFTVKVLATGVIAAVVTLLTIILLFQGTVVCSVFSSIIGRVHSITTLSHLCARKSSLHMEFMRTAGDLDTSIEAQGTAKEESR